MIDRNRLRDILASIGSSLTVPTKICLIGSGATLLMGQDDRQTPDIDVWKNRSSIDMIALKKACEDAGILFDPRSEDIGNSEYIQIVRSGVVSLPDDFPLENSESYGLLEVVTPPISLIAALKLARGNETDLQDSAWIVNNRLAEIDDIRQWAEKIPDPFLSGGSVENIMILELLTRDCPDDEPR